jgi:DNA replication protein DnaC
MSHARPSKKPELDVHAEAAALMHRIADPAPRSSPLRVVPTFVAEQGKCEMHGAYATNFRDAEGTVRWHTPGCPTCTKQAAVERLMTRAAISPRFQDCTFASYRTESEGQKLALDICERYAADFALMRRTGQCLILRGKPGTGKNHLATSIARTVLADGFTVLNATAFEIIRRIRDTWRDGATETEQQVIQAFADIDLLIIDELGRHHNAKDGKESVELFQVIDQRYRQIRPTVAISNLDRDGITKAIGAAAFDRLREGGASLVNFEWASARE